MIYQPSFKERLSYLGEPISIDKVIIANKVCSLKSYELNDLKSDYNSIVKIIDFGEIIGNDSLFAIEKFGKYGDFKYWLYGFTVYENGSWEINPIAILKTESSIKITKTLGEYVTSIDNGDIWYHGFSYGSSIWDCPTTLKDRISFLPEPNSTNKETIANCNCLISTFHPFKINNGVGSIIKIVDFGEIICGSRYYLVEKEKNNFFFLSGYQPLLGGSYSQLNVCELPNEELHTISKSLENFFQKRSLLTD